MFAYLAMIGFPSMLALSAPRSKSVFAIFGIALLFIVLIGLRYRVGMDWNNYAAIHQSLSGAALEQAAQSSEVASRLLMWASANYFDGVIGSNLAAAIVLMMGVLAIALRSREPWLALLAATPYLCIVIGMSGLRQSIAIGVFFLAVANWDRMSAFVRAGLIIAAALFHTSAIFMLALLSLTLRLGWVWKAIIIAIAAPLAVYYAQGASSLAPSFEAYAQNYLSVEGRIDSPGALGHVALVAFPASIYLLRRKRLAENAPNPELLDVAAWACLALVPLAFTYSTAASRFSLYFQFVPMLVWPALIGATSKNSRLGMRLGLVAAYSGYTVVWFAAANSAHAYLPYSNYLFQP
jgi:hypothetical protein